MYENGLRPPENTHSLPSLRLHISPHFLVQRPMEEVEKSLRRHGLAWADFTRLDERNRKIIGYQDVFPPKSGIFTFPSRELFVGQTIEEVAIPLNCVGEMRLRFEDARTGEVLPLWTNLTASILHPGSQGPQAVEIYNELSTDLIVLLPNLECLIDLVPLSGAALNGQVGRNFPRQRLGEIRLGSVFYREK